MFCGEGSVVKLVKGENPDCCDAEILRANALLLKATIAFMPRLLATHSLFLVAINKIRKKFVAKLC